MESLNDEIDDRFIGELGEASELVGDEEEVEGNKEKDDNLPWYMIEKNKTIMIVWEFPFALVIMYNMVTVPLMICFPWTI